ncbi:MAG: ABC transporter permease subunit, partial [SAR324 cluster bacterium]|nr:ABC transporter permease subunit [SAR324 cluster bacterium]
MKSILVIAVNSYREAVRSKILYTMFVFAIILILAAFFFGTVSIGSQSVVIQNFGLFAISVFTVAFACISGSSFLFKELKHRTIFTVLSRPVSRWQFIVGKYLGMLMTVTVMIIIMGAGLSLFVYAIEGALSHLLVKAYYNIWLELTIICAAAIFFSSIVVTPLLRGLLTFGIFLAGRSVEYLLYFVKDR